MKRLLLTGALALILSILPAADLFAQSYSGATISPDADGATYIITAEAGDTVTLSSVGNGLLSITFANNVNGSIEIRESQTRPSGASLDAPGAVATYFDVTLINITNDDISSSTWTFSVSKDFLNLNDAAAANVFLQHYNKGGWGRLTTQQVSETGTSVTFESDVNTFSPFAVTAVGGLSNTGSPYLMTGIVAMMTIVAVGATFMLSRKKQHQA